MSSHDHHHGHAHARQGRSLIVSICLNLGFSIAELIFGLIANSLALVADSIHDASDAVALGLSYFGLKMSERAPNRRRTFGYRKVRILTAFINALVLAGLTVFVVRAAVIRILHPEPVKSPILIVMAVVGLPGVAPDPCSGSGHSFQYIPSGKSSSAFSLMHRQFAS